VQRLSVLALAAALAGCAASGPARPAHASPELRLAPALLGRELALQQRITVHAPGHEQQVDALLEADAAHVSLGVVALGQVAARLSWDGVHLEETRASWWPPEVSGGRILSDLQLALWPADAVRAALPAGWRLDEAAGVRTLTDGGEVVAVVTRRPPDTVDIEQRRDHYRLTIESQDAGAPASRKP
jgi:hypothetical protein